MRVSGIQSVVMTGLMALWLSGCGDHNNFFAGLADDNSQQAKIQDAQKALDKGDCLAAIDGFTEVSNADPGNLTLRVNLAAAFMCRAGFSVTQFITVAADMATTGSGVTRQNVFKAVADHSVTLLNPIWQGDTDTAIGLLTPYAADPDVAFNLGIYNMIKATLIIVNTLDYINGLSQCGTSCPITDAQAQDMINALNASVNDLGVAGLVSTSVGDTVNTVLSDINTIDGIPSNPVTGADVNQYLTCQGINVPGYTPGPCP